MVFFISLAKASGGAIAAAPASPKKLRRFMRFTPVSLIPTLVWARSEDESSSKLDRSWNVALAIAANELAKLRRGRVDHRVRAKNRMVEGIECLRAYLQIHTLPDPRILGQGNLEFVAPPIAKIAKIQ